MKRFMILTLVMLLNINAIFIHPDPQVPVFEAKFILWSFGAISVIWAKSFIELF